MNSITFVLTACSVLGGNFVDGELKNFPSDPMTTVCNRLIRKKDPVYACTTTLSNGRHVNTGKNKATETMIYVKTPEGNLLASETMNRIYHWTKGRVIYHDRNLLKKISIDKVCVGTVRLD